jgi:octaprenyl-diphosphate synthase
MNPLPTAREAGLFAPIARDMDEVERLLKQTLSGSRPDIGRILVHLGPYRGKRLRPALLLLTARACGRLSPAHHILAAVVEMIHTATLVHDDVLDGATMRRHSRTVNADWGNQASVLLGDFLFTHAFHLSSTVGDVRACRLIGEATNRVCEGELHQVCERGNLALSEEDYLDIIDAKTAELTSCCCQLGALFSDAREDVVEALSRFGRYLGIAFQIADDVLDLTGEESVTGKSLGTDLEQQKLTLPVIHVLRTSPDAERVRQILQGPGNHKRDALGDYLEKADALPYAVARATEYARRARLELRCLAPSVYRDVLESLPERAVNRSC